jgi:hypothetical protein
MKRLVHVLQLAICMAGVLMGSLLAQSSSSASGSGTATSTDKSNKDEEGSATEPQIQGQTTQGSSSTSGSGTVTSNDKRNEDAEGSAGSPPGLHGAASDKNPRKLTLISRLR